MIYPAGVGPAESESDSNESRSDSTEGPGWGRGPENRDQTDEEDDPGEFLVWHAIKMKIVL